jgi:pimeloyl-ACP methyl ester carboxylesterase
MSINICRGWDSGLVEPWEYEPLVSSIPALILHGELDPIMAPSYGHDTSKTLSNHFIYEFPNLGHGVMRGSDCALQIGLQFLDDPTTTPDASCMPE